MILVPMFMPISIHIFNFLNMYRVLLWVLSLFISLSTQESTWNQITLKTPKIKFKNKKKRMTNWFGIRDLILRCSCDLVMRGEILYLWFAIWFYYVLNFAWTLAYWLSWGWKCLIRSCVLATNWYMEGVFIVGLLDFLP